MIVAIGNMECDDKETSFKKWHDEISGRVSKHDASKINNGVMSRTRIRAFTSGGNPTLSVLIVKLCINAAVYSKPALEIQMVIG